MSPKILFFLFITSGLVPQASQAMQTRCIVTQKIPLLNVIQSAPWLRTGDHHERVIDMKQFNTALETTQDIDNGPYGQSFLSILITECIQKPEPYAALLQKSADPFKRNQNDATPRQQIEKRKAHLEARLQRELQLINRLHSPMHSIETFRNMARNFHPEIGQWENIEKMLKEAEQKQQKKDGATIAEETKTNHATQVNFKEIERRIKHIVPHPQTIFILKNGYLLVQQLFICDVIFNNDASRLLQVLDKQATENLLQQQKPSVFNQASLDAYQSSEPKEQSVSASHNTEPGYTPRTIPLQVANLIFWLAPNTVEIAEQQYNGEWPARQEDGSLFYFNADATKIVQRTDVQGRRITSPQQAAPAEKLMEAKLPAAIVTSAINKVQAKEIPTEIEKRIYLQAPYTIRIEQQEARGSIEWCALQANGSRRYFNEDATGEFDPN